jgi:hypothetical protein
MAVLKYKDKNGQWKSIASGGSNSGGGNVNVDLSGYATKQELDNKVDKVTGKQLSTEDFTTALKNKLNGLSNYDDTAVNNAINGLQTQINTLVSGDANTAIESFNEIIAFLDGVTDTQTLEGIIAGIEQQIAGKQAIISDLAAIRSGANAGATAVQPASLASVATSGSYTDLKDKPTIPDSLSDLSADSTHRTVTDTEKATWNAKSNFSGSYTDLTDKPTIPSAVTESTVSGWGFTKNTGTYSKPSTGIPASDLTSAVQTSLGKADTALQSYTETDPVFKASAASNITSADITNWNSKISQPAYTLINQGTSNTNIALSPNTLYVWGTVSALTLTFGEEISGIANEYLFQFTCGTTATTLSLPTAVKWAGGEAPTIEASKTYQVSILNNCATLLAF